MTRKYISATYNDETKQKLTAWCKKNGYDTTLKYDGTEVGPEGFKFHSTIIYSQNEYVLTNKTIDLIHCEVIPIGFALFGDEQNIPVMLVKSSALSAFRDFYELMGLQDTREEYSPHISLSYGKYTILPRSLPDFPLIFDRIEIDDIGEEL